MHAVYFFLMSLEDADDLEGAELLANAEETFSGRFSDNLDENNWWTAQAVVCEDGASAISSEIENPDYPLEDFQTLRRIATQAVITDLSSHLHGVWDVNPLAFGARGADETRMDQMTLAELLTEVGRKVPPALSEMYARMSVDGGAHGDLQGYQRRRAVEIFERLLGCDTPPFASDGTPYEYRAFDLTWGEDGRKAIFLVDIHT